MMRLHFRHVFKGELIESDGIDTDVKTWLASPESKDPAWSVIFLGRKVRALRLPPLPCVHADAENAAGSLTFGANGNTVTDDGDGTV